MTVKELIEALSYCNPNAKICVEAYMDPAANEVMEYVIDNKPYVYIGDDLRELEYNLGLRDDEEE